MAKPQLHLVGQRPASSTMYSPRSRLIPENSRTWRDGRGIFFRFARCAMDYLPKLVTTEQACAWLSERTSGTWVLARLLENGLVPWFWLDYSASADPRMFGGRVEGYLAPMAFQGDIQRLESDGTDALVNWTRTHDGTPVQVLPPGIMRVPLSELKFKREDIESLWLALGGGAAVAEEPEAATTAKSAVRWTPEFVEEVRAFRSRHTAKKTAEHFGVSEQRIRSKLAPPAASAAAPSPFIWKKKR